MGLDHLWPIASDQATQVGPDATELGQGHRAGGQRTGSPSHDLDRNTQALDLASQRPIGQGDDNRVAASRGQVAHQCADDLLATAPIEVGDELEDPDSVARHAWYLRAAQPAARVMP